ncbi:MAG: potassium transporter Kup [Myxococcales bacterium]|nr:potassium transporter Kup [Myxococcales bacterium]
MNPSSQSTGSSPAEASHHGHGHGSLAPLALAALGVVYGDIGTSPLYAIKECFTGAHGMPVNEANVFGILSLVFWSLMLVIVLKYLSFIMRADNHGEGGILALLALVHPADAQNAKKDLGRTVLIVGGLFGAALLYGDGIITPAISVLSAVEGLEVATDKVHPFIVPITVAILIGLFLVQKRGTAKVGAVFGPAMLVWFGALAITGLRWIVKAPQILSSINPLHAVHFFRHHGHHGFLMLGSVVLCITGGEALYADMGHFGKKPIRAAWFTVAMPALLLNYFGQGALLLTRGAVENPFFGLVSGVMVYPMVAIATVATVVASQALISGAYSITQQAIQLGYWPRMTIVHTSNETEGQIYIPEINSFLMIACVLLVMTFRASSGLAAAYGIAVTGTMSITSILFYAVATGRWGWSPLKAGSLVGLFLVFDLAFFAANAVKIAQGGWFPLVVAAAIFTMMTTWKKGRAALGRYMIANTLPLDLFMADVRNTRPPRVKGTAVFMTGNPDGAPPVLLHHFKHNKVLHKQVVLLSVATEHRPEVPEADRVTIRDVGEGFFQVTARYGFMQTPNVLDVLASCEKRGLVIDKNDTSFFLGRETLLTTGRADLSHWRKALFSFLSRNARPANAFFQIPPNRVVELGTQVEL